MYTVIPNLHVPNIWVAIFRNTYLNAVLSQPSPFMYENDRDMPVLESLTKAWGFPLHRALFIEN